MQDDRPTTWEAPQEGPAGHPAAEGHAPSGAPAAPPVGGQGPVPPAAGPSKDEKTWAMLAHLAALAGLVVPLGSIIGPLVVWLVKKDESPFVDHQGKEALNFQITIAIAVLIATVVSFMGAALALILIGIPILIVAFAAMAVLYLIGIVFAIIAGIKANEGVWYRYPMAWRFIQ